MNMIYRLLLTLFLVFSVVFTACENGTANNMESIDEEPVDPIGYYNMVQGMAFNEKSSMVIMKSISVDKKGRTEIKIYIDTSNNGIVDTMLSFKIQEEKEQATAQRGLDTLIHEGSIITFSDANIKSPSEFYKTIIWHDLISVDGRSLILLYPNPYWFPFAFAKNQG
jgi:hypothetical protein